MQQDSTFLEELYLLDISQPSLRYMVNHNNLADRSDLCVGDESFKFLPYQLSMVVYWTTMALTGNGGLGFDSGEGA